MSYSIGNLKYIRAIELNQWLKQGCTALGEKFQVVDVRGSDYIGGHIVGGWHIAYSNLINGDGFELLHKRLEDNGVGVVVFHCMQSQQRGPSAALKYLRKFGEERQVCILEGGFYGWQALYGSDPTVTEGYIADLWQAEQW